MSSCMCMQLLHSVTGQAPHMNSTIVMCGIAKLLVGDLVETGIPSGLFPVYCCVMDLAVSGRHLGFLLLAKGGHRTLLCQDFLAHCHGELLAICMHCVAFRLLMSSASRRSSLLYGNEIPSVQI